MKVSIINHTTNGSTDVDLCTFNGRRAWVAISDNRIICNVDELPEHMEVVYDVTEEKEALGQWLTERIKASTWKKSKLVDAANISRANILRYERGETGMTIDTFVKLCYLLGEDVPSISNITRKQEV